MPSIVRRVDLDDGKPYSYQELFNYYIDQFGWSPEQVDQYWSSLKPLRFRQGDRVLCNIVRRRVLGTVLEADAEDDLDPNGPRLPYVVKCDALPGRAGGALAVPSDSDQCIIRERCFDRASEDDLAKWAAPILPASLRKTRFGLNDSVCIRVADNETGYDQWVKGIVQELWPKLPGEPGEGILKAADVVAYLVETEPGQLYYCHRDEHSFIRKPENAPRKPHIGNSERFEHRKRPDGTLESFDHATLRSKLLSESDDEATGSEMDEAAYLTVG